MGKQKSSHVILMREWLRKAQNPSHYRIENDKYIYCEPCGKIFEFKKLYGLLQHEKTDLHTKSVTRFNAKAERQMLLSDMGPTVENEFYRDLSQALVAANIPWYKLQNPIFKNFLEKYTNKTVPDESTLRKSYLKKLYTMIVDAIRSDIGLNYIWLSIDETTDAAGRYIANVLVGRMDKDKFSKSHLLASKQLEKTNSSTVTQLVLDALLILWPLSTQTDIDRRFLLLLTDGVAYMKKAGKNLKNTYPNLLHVTCVTHGLHLVAEEVRSNFSDVDKLVASVKAVFRKSPSRILKYRNMFPKLELPPQPVISRWGTWLTAIEFYSKNFESVKSVVEALNSTESAAILKAQEMFSKERVRRNLSYISVHYGFLCETIKTLEGKEISLSETLELVTSTTEKLSEAKGSIGEKVLLKWKNVLNKNKDLEAVTKIDQILHGEENIELSLNPSQIAAFKFAPLTTVDNERSFSFEKLIFSDRRRGMTAEHLEWTVVSYFEMIS